MPESMQPQSNLIDITDILDRRRKAVEDSRPTPERIAPIAKEDLPEEKPRRQLYNDNGALSFESPASSRIFLPLKRSWLEGKIEQWTGLRPVDLASLQGYTFRMKDNERLIDSTKFWEEEFGSRPAVREQLPECRVIDLNELVVGLDLEGKQYPGHLEDSRYNSVMSSTLESLEHLIVRWQIPDQLNVNQYIETPLTVLIGMSLKEKLKETWIPIQGQKRVVMRYGEELLDVLLHMRPDANSELGERLDFLMKKFKSGEDYVAYRVIRGAESFDKKQITLIRNSISRLPDRNV